MVHGPVLFFSSVTAVWLFYIQHQYEFAYWEKKEKWDYYGSGLFGSSVFVLPRILQWFTGNIGFHSIHHISTKIPNYRLQECYEDQEQIWKQGPHLTLLQSLRCFSLALWDEEQKRLIRFRDLR